MRWRPLILVSAALVITLTAMFALGLRVLERDRTALYAQLGHDREVSLQEAARGLASDIVDISDDLALAAAVLRSADSETLTERELNAIATIKREYLVMHARDASGRTTKVAAYNAPPNSAELFDAALSEALATARDRLRVSAPDGAPWVRIFARRPTAGGPTVAVAVDMTPLLARLRVQKEPNMRLVVLDGAGHAAATSDRTLAQHLHEPTLASVIAQATGGATARVLVPAWLARELGLPDAAALAIGVPLTVDSARSWTLLWLGSTATLQHQEQVIVRRVLVGGVLVLVLLLSAAAYVLYNTFRGRELREKIAHAEHLAHLNEKAEAILDHIPSGVLALTEERKVTGTNRWLQQRLQRVVLGLPLAEAFPTSAPEDIARLEELVRRALATREPAVLHAEHTTLFDSDAALHIHAVPLARRSGDVSVLIVFEDLTALRLIERRLVHSEKLVMAGQLAAGIAHEIGTPLNVARGRIELSLSHLGAEHAEANNQRIVIDQIDRVTRLIQQLLDYVRPMPALIQPIDLGASLGAVKELLAPQAAKRKVELAVESEPTTIVTDAEQLQQIVMNLAVNAVDACDRGGRVVLRASARPGSVVLEVTDNGHGIPAQILSQVYDPFFTTKKRGQGTGLGLWVVAQLVRAQAAEIEMDSAPGKGTTVRVVWPVTS